MKIKIRDFQPFSEVELEADGLTVITGKSNLGKSSFIRAIESALFGREGEAFVRNGRQTAVVNLENVPALGKVEWSKGGGNNKFTINEIVYSKTGTTVPAPIQEAGYKEVWIGDKERKRGEFIRPQVADQFDRLFLLDRPGSFVAEVLSTASRIGVLTNADRACAGDLKATKALLNIRLQDLAKAKERVEALKPVLMFHERIKSIRSNFTWLSNLRARMEKLATLIEQRKRIQSAYLKLPPQQVFQSSVNNLETKVGLTNKIQTALHQLSTLKSMYLELPKHQVDWLIAMALGSNQRKLTLIPLVKKQKFNIPTIPDSAVIAQSLLNRIEPWVDTAKHLTKAIEQQKKWFYDHHAQSVAVKSLKTDEEMLVSELDKLKLAMKFCPVCDQPFQYQAHEATLHK